MRALTKIVITLLLILIPLSEGFYKISLASDYPDGIEPGNQEAAEYDPHDRGGEDELVSDEDGSEKVPLPTGITPSYRQLCDYFDENQVCKFE